MKYFRYVSVLIFFLSAGCATLSGGRIHEVESRKVDYVLSENKGPVVVFESGLGGRYDWWAKIYPEIAKEQTAFAYNRPGYGKSDSVTTTRDAETIVLELRETLKSLGLRPPYVLVGHSSGGLYFQYFARRYPEEVKALLLVDPTHPRQMQGDGAIAKWPWWVRTAIQIITPKAGLIELEQVEKSGEQVLALPDLDTQKIHTVILLATEPEDPQSPLEKNAVLMRQDFRTLYPSANFITVKGDHAIPLHSPQVIIDQIKKISQ